MGTLLALALIAGIYQTLGSSNDVGKMSKMSFKTPELTEEDERSDHMPDYLKCEACQAIAYQIETEFKNKKGRNLLQSEILEITEKLVHSGFEEYGIKDISGTNHLTGPGLTANNKPGIVQMGGKWPKRLRSMCGFYLGEIDEDVLYDVFRSQKQSLVKFLCNSNNKIRGRCISKTVRHKDL